MKPIISCQAYRPAVCSDRSTTVQVLIRVATPPVQNQKRPPLNLGLAIDTSGSMSGEPIQRASQASVHLVQSLRPSDSIAAVSFSSHAQVVSPTAEVRNQSTIIKQLSSLQAMGGTDLYQGWVEASHQVFQSAQARRVNRVILLSDGQANQGLTDPDRIAWQVAEWRSKGITTTTVGLGLDYNEDLLAQMATAGGGNFFHIPDPASIGPLFQVELHGLCSTFGRAVTLGIEALDGVELLRVFNPLQRTQSGHLGLADLVHGCPLELVVELRVEASSDRAKELCCLDLAWTSVETGRKRRLKDAFTLPVVPHGQLIEFPLCDEVMQKRALQLAAQKLREAVVQIDAHNHEKAREVLQIGLDTLNEATPSSEIENHKQKLRRLQEDLVRGATRSVRKEATYASRSVSYSSINLSGGVQKFLALPAAERTPEKLRELMGD